MYSNEKKYASEVLKGDSADRQNRQIMRLLEEIRADVTAIRQQLKEENA